MYPKRYQADILNTKMYDSLPESQEYTYQIKVDIDKTHSTQDGDPDIITNNLRSSIMADEEISKKPYRLKTTSISLL